MKLNPCQPALNLQIFAYAVLEADGYAADGTLFLPYGNQYTGVLLPTVSTGNNIYNVTLLTNPRPAITQLQYVYVSQTNMAYPVTGLLVINANAVSGNAGLLIGDDGNCYSVIYDGTVFSKIPVVIINNVTPAGIILTKWGFTTGQAAFVFGENGSSYQPQLLNPVPIFNYVQFIIDYPQFANLSAINLTNQFNYSATVLGQVASGLFTDIHEQYYWICVVLAHLLTLETTGMVGRLSDVKQSSESGKFEMNAPAYADYWQSTVYGQRIYQIIQEYLMGGHFIPSGQGAPYMGQAMNINGSGAGSVLDRYSWYSL